MQCEILTGQPTFACKVCSRNFISKDLFDKHVQECLEKKTFQCEVCNKNYAKKIYLNKHMQYLHSRMRTFTCKICNKKFSEESLLKRHVKYHSEKPYGCEKCHYRFADETKLREHLERHSEECLHVCEVCNRKCKTKQDLTIHKYSHGGKRKIVVKAETADAVTYSQLMRKNSNTYVKRTKNAPEDNPYVCEICNTGCKTNADLMIHKDIHNVRVKSETEKFAF